MKKIKKGISLITLVITIIVVIILAAVVILALQKNNPIDMANKAKFMQNVDTFKNELELYKQNKYINNVGKFDPDSIQANVSSLKEEGKVIDNKNIYDVIELLKSSGYADDTFVVVEGKLVYKGINSKEQEWSKDAGITVDNGSVNISLVAKQNFEIPYKQGIMIQYAIKIYSDQGIKDISKDVLKSAIKVVDKDTNELITQPIITVDDISGTDNEKDTIITIDTANMQDGKYTIKIAKNTIENKANKANDEVIDSKDMFEIDNTAPEAPIIAPNITTSTNENVVVTITYSDDAIVKQYSYDGENWNDYTSALTITDNCTVYAIAKDVAGNVSSQSTLSITNIDKVAPVAPTIIPNTTSPTNQDITATIKYPDDAVVKQYSYDGKAWNDYTNALTITDNCTVYAIAKDAAGNVSSQSTLNITNIDKTNPIYTSYEINNVTASGYDVYVYGISDVGSGINRVQFPTWTDANGQDDIDNNWAYSSGVSGESQGNGTWHYRVNVSSHNNESGKYNTYVYIYDNAGNNISFATSGANVPTPYPYNKSINPISEGGTATPLGENSTIDGQNPIYSDPVIPAGFVPVNTTDANWNNISSGSWNNGLVIQDSYGNQFVWVPVDGSNVKYQKDFTFPSAYSASYSNTIDGTFIYGDESAQINKYHGFYIARYESSFDYNNGNIRPAVIKSHNYTYSTNWSQTRNSTYQYYLWNYINAVDAKKYSESMSNSCNYYSNIGTTLITGTQWDTVMTWVKNAGYAVTNDSYAWGNYSYSDFDYDYPSSGHKYSSINSDGLLNTGATKRNSAKNIYDLAGNLWEWTNETFSDISIARGGNCAYYVGYDYGVRFPAAYRDYTYAKSLNLTGFRVTLYLH